MNAVTHAPATSLAQPILLALGRVNPTQLEADRLKRAACDSESLLEALEGRLEEAERWDGMA